MFLAVFATSLKEETLKMDQQEQSKLPSVVAPTAAVLPLVKRRVTGNSS
jgi:hypothetical protein